MNDEEEVPLSYEKKIPRYLWVTYLILLIWGIGAFLLYWNGTNGFWDRGYQQKLQQAANTTYPFNKN